jgi:hypothetical protein
MVTAGQGLVCRKAWISAPLLLAAISYASLWFQHFSCSTFSATAVHACCSHCCPSFHPAHDHWMTITFKPIQQEYLAAVKTLNSVVFPVKYHVGCGQLGSLAHTPHRMAWVATCAASPAQLLQTSSMFEAIAALPPAGSYLPGRTRLRPRVSAR